MIRSLLDYYRCPEEFVRFRVAADLGAAQGFFRFGEQITGFGRTAGPAAAESNGDLPDVFSLHEIRAREVVLPFDPDEVIENLRREKYVAAPGAASFPKKLIREAYYAARPLLPVGVRKHLQRFHLRSRRDIAFPSWLLDKTVDNLCARLLSLAVQASGSRRIPFIWFWPDEYRGCVLMTHDVEHEAGRAFCGELMDLNNRYGIRSAFQVVPEDRYGVHEDFLEGIRARGFELNVHDLNHDGHLFDNREQFLKRAEKINGYASDWGAEGFRTGGMYRNAEWCDAFRFHYDMSFPSAAHLEPQAGGCCTVMPYFLGDLVELPLTTTQDYSLLHILDQYSIELWKQELDTIGASNGLATFIVHPDYVIDRRARRVYEELLRYLAELCSGTKLWQPLPRDVARWWRERSQMRIERSGDSWKVTGPGSERARLAFAQVEEGRLTYQVDNSSCPKTTA